MGQLATVLCAVLVHQDGRRDQETELTSEAGGISPSTTLTVGPIVDLLVHKLIVNKARTIIRNSYKFSESGGQRKENPKFEPAQATWQDLVSKLKKQKNKENRKCWGL